LCDPFDSHFTANLTGETSPRELCGSRVESGDPSDGRPLTGDLSSGRVPTFQIAVAGVEVKAAATVTTADFRGLRRLREAAGRRFAGGVVLYDGETSAGFGDGLHAVPLRALWETT